MHMMKKTAALLLGLLLAAAAAQAEVTPLPIDLSGGLPYAQENRLSEDVYEDESLRVEISRTTVGVTKCYIARVTIKDPSQLRTAPAYAFNRDQVAPMDAIANRVNAVLAINGDYFSYQAVRGSYMVRQGETYINKPIQGRDVLIIDGNGDFYIEKEINDEVLAKYAQTGVVNSFNFGPGIITDGEVLKMSKAVYNQAEDKAARSCIAQVERGRMEYLCIVTEGSRDAHGGGMTLVEFAEFVSSFGVQNAYNLDGGNSAALIFMGEKLNAVNNKNHRELSDIIYFASAASDGE